MCNIFFSLDKQWILQGENLEKGSIKKTCVPNLVLATEMRVEGRSLYFCLLWIECMKVAGTQWNPRRNKASEIHVLVTLNLIFSSVGILNYCFVVKYSFNIVSYLYIFTGVPLPGESGMS